MPTTTPAMSPKNFSATLWDDDVAVCTVTGTIKDLTMTLRFSDGVEISAPVPDDTDATLDDMLKRGVEHWLWLRDGGQMLTPQGLPS